MDVNLKDKLWHNLETSEVISLLESSESGLTEEKAALKLEEYGHNKLKSEKTVSIWEIIFGQLINPLIVILLIAAVISAVIGDIKDAAFILLVIVINTLLGAYQEYNAEKSASNLQSMIKIKSRVVRSGKEGELDSEYLVPGDIVLLESGMKVPADLRLTEEHNLEADESFLTGESVPAVKRTGVLPEKTDIPERANMAFAGATVITGRGRGIVVKTGLNTEVGKISVNVSESESAKPPLIVRMEKFIKQISGIILVICIILGIILRMQGMENKDVFFFVVALAVAAIPEGLPVALTVALSIAVKKMADRNVIVRRLTHVESLGSCTVIASDKTGTLTVNEQTAKIIILADGTEIKISGEGYNDFGILTRDGEEVKLEPSGDTTLDTLIRIGVLANEAALSQKDGEWEHHGDAMDIALLSALYKSGSNLSEISASSERKGIIPYESEKKYSGVFYKKDGKIYSGIKGAVETVIALCGTKHGAAPSEHFDRDEVINTAEKMAARGYRILAFAQGVMESFDPNRAYEAQDLPAMQFYGLACFIDPLRPDAKPAVDKCKKAGIKVIMITGDHPATAENIARELGIATDEEKAVTGAMLSEVQAGSSEFSALVNKTSVFARVSPSQKLEIVDSIIKAGEFVAVTGDGVNDAPALKRANIGVAMGSGTDVAKEVGSMIVVDDKFSSIVAGVEEGRFAYDNVRKVVFLLISTGAAEVLLFILSVIAKLPLPILAVQLLWLNLVTNGIQDVALAFEAGEDGAMDKKPRKPSESIFNPPMIRQTLVSGFIIGTVVFGFWLYLNRYTAMGDFHARSMVVLLMVFMQNLHALNSRSETRSVFNIPVSNNYILIFGILAAQTLHVLCMHIPFMQNVLSLEPVTLSEWLQVFVLSVPIIAGMEIYKLIRRRRTEKESN